MVTLKVKDPWAWEGSINQCIRKVVHSGSPQSEVVKHYLMGLYSCNLVHQFDRLLALKKLNDARQLMQVWSDALPVSTRPIEAQGGQMTKAVQKASATGLVVGVVSSFF